MPARKRPKKRRVCQFSDRRWADLLLKLHVGERLDGLSTAHFLGLYGPWPGHDAVMEVLGKA